jgi:hypothetical protein
LPKKKYVKNIPVKEDEHYGMTDFISLMAAYIENSITNFVYEIAYYPIYIIILKIKYVLHDIE